MKSHSSYYLALSARIFTVYELLKLLEGGVLHKVVEIPSGIQDDKKVKFPWPICPLFADEGRWRVERMSQFYCCLHFYNVAYIIFYFIFHCVGSFDDQSSRRRRWHVWRTWRFFYTSSNYTILITNFRRRGVPNTSSILHIAVEARVRFFFFNFAWLFFST